MAGRGAYYRFVSVLAGLTGYRGAETVAAALASVRLGFNRKHNATYEEHLSRIFSGLDRSRVRGILSGYWRVHQRAFLGLFHSRKFDINTIEERVSWDGRELLDEALEEGRGVILLVPHFGDERTLHILLAICGYPMHVISTKYENAPELVREARLGVSQKWHHVAFPDDNPRWIYQSLSKGEVLQLSPTAWGGPRGHWVRSFGVPVLANSSALRIASTTGSRLLIAFNQALPGVKYRISFRGFNPGESGPEASQRLFSEFETIGREFPQQYNWMNLVIRHRETNTIYRLGGIPRLEQDVESAALDEDWDPRNIRDLQSVSSIGSLR